MKGFYLNNGVVIPCIGYGTWRLSNEEAEHSVCEALRAGYRLIDTASYYGNEKGVGEAVRKSCISREEIFVTSKVWNTDRGYDKTKDAFARTMQNLKLEYLDLYLIHCPANYKQFGDHAKEINAGTWCALEELYSEGRIKSIGLSNFLAHHIDTLMETAKIKPMVNQIEFHPGWNQEDTIDYCHKNSILVQGWKTLGRNGMLRNQVLMQIAQKYDKNTAQLCIRWAIQHGIVPLVKSAYTGRIDENIKVFDFIIDVQDMETIDSLQFLEGQGILSDEVDY